MSISATTIIMAVLIIGASAFLVSVVTQMTKNIGVLAKIPTDLQVILLSIIICLILYFAYASYVGVAILWYYVAGVIIGSFIVALVARDGWSTVVTLLKRFISTSTASEIVSTVIDTTSTSSNTDITN